MRIERWRITGRVQGVSYRYFIKRTADQLGLVGWVRNRLDGSVELLVSGNLQEMESLHTAAAKGPFLANVASIQREGLSEGNADADGFEIRETM